MRLPTVQQSLTEMLKEFDVWITPSLGDISDTDKFREELERVAGIFEILGETTGNFSDESHCKPEIITATFAQIVSTKSVEERHEILKSLASTLYLVTGKSDNNLKCQFPLYLRDVARWQTVPTQGRRGITEKPIPRTMKSDDIMNQIALLGPTAQGTRFLENFVAFLLGSEDASRQFWSLGHSYYNLKSFGRGYESNLLAPIVIFKVRGSVTASGGHEPEIIMRSVLDQWGLIAGEDYNTTDVVVDQDSEPGKTRAYDFILPFKTEHWGLPWHNRLMVQCQFYAGDSGSVSHKNVDQTETSRTRVASKYRKVRFIEYVDGAGYFSSLNSDLKKLLEMPTTASFTQIRSIPIRLRRELQQLGFLTPLEIEHAIAQTDGARSNVVQLLEKQRYKKKEIDRAIQIATNKSVIKSDKKGRYRISDERRNIVRQYFILDTLACLGDSLPASKDGTTTSAVLTPGYGAFYGLDMDVLVERLLENAGQLHDELAQSKTLMADLKELARQGFCFIGR